MHAALANPEYAPEPHGTHAVAPALAAKVPAAHAAQSEPGAAAAVPGAQSAHAAAPGGDDVPALQARHVAPRA